MKKLILLTLTCMFSILMGAQTAGDIDTSFMSGTGFKSLVSPNISVIQADGRIIFGGGFVTYNGVDANRIVRLNPDGTKDATFNIGTGFNNTVRAVALQPDGKILVGGAFTSYNGTSANRIIRLNPDGTIDATFVIGTGFNNQVFSISIQPDSKIIIGGMYTSYNGTTSIRAIRLTSLGAIDFAAPVGFNSTILTIALQADAKGIFGGTFTTADGTSANRIVRINPTGLIDGTFITGTGFDSSVSSIAIQSDQQIIVGGNFINYNGTSINRIVRLNSDGSIDPAFNTGTGFNNNVDEIAIQTDGKIIVAGSFTAYNGTAVNNVVRLDANGTIDATFNIGTGFNNGAFALSIQTDGKIVLGGSFTSYNGSNSITAIRLNTDGTKDTSFNPGSGFNGNGNVWPMLEQSDGKIITAGTFNLYNGVSGNNNIKRLNSDGTTDPLFAQTGSGLNGGIWAMALQLDGKIVLGGSNFTAYNGIAANRIVRLNVDGTLDATFNTGIGFNSAVRCITIQSDGKLLIGGDFTTYNGTTVGHILRLETTGIIDPTFNTGIGFNDIVLPIMIQSNGKILVGGVFTSYNGTAANSIISLNTDGTVDTSFITGTGFDLTPEAVKLQSDGRIIIVGDFNTYNGFASKGIVRLNSDGTRDTSFNAGIGFNGDVYCSLTQPDGKIMVGGFYSTYDGISVNNIIRLNADGTNDVSFILGAGFNSGTISMVRQSTGKLIVSGAFTTYKGIMANNIVRLESTTLGVDEFTLNEGFKLYPNPVVEILNLDLDVTITPKSYKIYNVMGKIVSSNELLGNQINVSVLSKGIYILKVATDKGLITNRFIKN